MHDELKGRVFVLYDMVFNVALVLAAVVGALILPADGKSVPILSCWPSATWSSRLVHVVSRGISMDEGTESLLAEPVAPTI